MTAAHNSRPAKQRLISLRIIAGCQSCQLCQEISLALLSLIEMKFFFTKYFQSPSLPLCGAGLSYRVFIRVDSLRHIRTISPHSLPSPLDNTSEVSQVRECRVSCRNNPPNQTKLLGRHQVKGAVGFVLIEGSDDEEGTDNAVSGPVTVISSPSRLVLTGSNFKLNLIPFAFVKETPPSLNEVFKI